VERIRISRKPGRRDRELRDAARAPLSLDPRDPDIVRARRLAEHAALERIRRRTWD
jgi:hypothetical protein